MMIATDPATRVLKRAQPVVDEFYAAVLACGRKTPSKPQIRLSAVPSVPWWMVFALALGFALTPAAAARPFEVRDSIEIADFIEAPLFSPDERHFVTVTQRGVLPQGVTEATLWLFETAAVRRSIADASPIEPVPLARISGAINTGPGALGSKGLVTKISWTPDGTKVVFLGRSGQDNRQLFRVSLDDRKAISLSPATQDVVDFAIAGHRIVYFAGPDASTRDLWTSMAPSLPDVVVGTGMSLTELLYPNVLKSARNLPTPFEVWSIEGPTAAPVKNESLGAPLSVIGSYHVSAMTVSPDGTRLITIVHADEIPNSWTHYEFSREADTRAFLAHAASENPQQDFGRALQYQVIDLDKGERQPLLDAPLADWQRGGEDALHAVWSTDGRYVAASGTYLPLDPRTGKGSLTTCGVAVVDTQSRKFQCLVDHTKANAAPVQGLSWQGTRRLEVSFSNATSLDYEQRNGRWNSTASAAVAAPHSPPLELSIRQALNDPPTLFAKDLISGLERRIFDPNPQLADIAMGTVTEVFWTDAHGRTINGGLVKPADFVTGKRYPLVIQTHNFRPRKFFRTGISDTASAGRALAARGMLVLQVDEPMNAFMFTPREATENGTNVYLAAIDKLASDGLVDSKRVGITGYSRTAFYVSKAITDAPDRFAAVVVANGDPGSLIGYYAGITGAIDEDKWTGLFAGAQPYGDGLKQWIVNAPGFRTERIQAPVLIAAGDPGHLLPLWGLYAPLRQQGKPVELQYIRGGQHNLNKPLEVLAHQELIVDWFDFWLNGHEDPSTDKLDQYRRWKAFRKVGLQADSVDRLSD
jgi:dipeptidyl aminopeptidase/acylaminoacyl peptidase